jgi:hypothetical protein
LRTPDSIHRLRSTLRPGAAGLSSLAAAGLSAAIRSASASNLKPIETSPHSAA